jgi:hypothetical protein
MSGAFLSPFGKTQRMMKRETAFGVDTISRNECFASFRIRISL